MHTVVQRVQILLCLPWWNLIEKCNPKENKLWPSGNLFDIKGAFDNLAFMAIEKAMIDNNYPPLMIRWFMNFLKK